MHFDTAQSQLEALRSRRISAVELLAETVARIETVDRELNAIVVRDFEGAHQAARDADGARAAGDSRPLLGLPVTVKESINVAGLPTTWGYPGTETIPVREDAVVVRRLKQAGAVLVGKTNVPPGLADYQSANPVYGRTNNPWDLTRTPGGSSGGSAAALAAGLVPLETGSDIGGSLRVPAHCCGIYAHKPSWGIVPTRGNAPPGTPTLSIGLDIDLVVVGPMARSAADLELALDVLAGPDDSLATAWSLALPAPRSETLQGCRVLVLTEHPLLMLSAEVGGAIESFIEQLARAGCVVGSSSSQLPDLVQASGTYIKLLMAQMGARVPDAQYAAQVAAARHLSADDTSLAAMVKRAMVASYREWTLADRVRAGLRHRWAEVFAEWDVVLCPVMPLPALPHDAAPFEERQVLIDGRPTDYGALAVWNGLATAARLPATALPIGLGTSGLPIGVQAIGPHLEDRTPLAFARGVEREFGGFVAPPRYA